MLHGASLEQSDEIAEETVRKGKVLVGNCQHCGRQWKGLVYWPEIMCWFLGRPVQNCRATRQGVVVACGCACGKVTPMLVRWHEVKNYVEEGVQSGSLPPDIFAATGAR